MASDIILHSDGKSTIQRMLHVEGTDYNCDLCLNTVPIEALLLFYAHGREYNFAYRRVVVVEPQFGWWGLCASCVGNVKSGTYSAIINRARENIPDLDLSGAHTMHSIFRKNWKNGTPLVPPWR